jgi:hypothetical protein
MSSDKEILALEDKRYAAMCGGDFAALEAMLHDELLYTHSSGLTGTRKDLRLVLPPSSRCASGDQRRNA